MEINGGIWKVVCSPEGLKLGGAGVDGCGCGRGRVSKMEGGARFVPTRCDLAKAAEVSCGYGSGESGERSLGFLLQANMRTSARWRENGRSTSLNG